MIDDDASAKAALYALIRRFEGLYLKPYLCPAGVLTIGYGTTGQPLTPDAVWTVEQAEAAMQKEANVCYTAAKKLAKDATYSQWVALADFSYNLSVTRLAGSTLLKKINAGDRQAAKLEIEKWVWAGGKVLPGLIARRAAESNLL
jgi:lysozyme